MGRESIWVWVEQDAGEVEPSSLEVLSKAREVADKYNYEVAAIVMGEKVEQLAPTLGRYGAHRVLLVEHPVFKHYTYYPYYITASRLVEEKKPNTFLFSATRNGRDLAGRLAVRFKTCLMAHIISIDYDKEGRLVGGVPGFGGNIVAVVSCTKGRPQMATVAPGVFEAVERGSSEPVVEKYSPPAEVEKTPVRIIERKIGEIVDLSRSEKVVVAGMGTGGNLELAKKLCEIIGADLGATRPLADIGVVPRDLQIGTTGVSLKSKLAIVLGASGAPHFVSGLLDVKKVISINKDPEAPMKEYSDYYAVGDLFEIVPILIKKLEEKKR